SRFDNTREDTVLTGETGVRVHFRTGIIGHAVSLSGATYELDSKNAYAMSSGGVNGNIYRPTYIAPPAPTAWTGGDLADPRQTIRTRMQSVAISDQISLFDERLLLTLGARYQDLLDRSYAYGSSTRSANYEDHAVTPSLGALYKFTPEISVYANYIEGLVRGDSAPAQVSGQPVSNAGEKLEPYKTKQSEVGLKYDGGTLGGSVSVYHSRKPVAGLDGNSVYEILDHQENTGLELQAYVQLTPTMT